MSAEADILDDQIFENERDVATLRRHSRKLLGELKQAKARIKELETLETPVSPVEGPREKFCRENAERLSPFEKNSPEWQAEFDKINAEMDPLIEREAEEAGQKIMAYVQSLRGQIARVTRNNEATRIASKLAIKDSVSLLLPFVAERVHVELVDGDPVVKFRDADGAEISEETLASELVRNPSLSRIIENPQARAGAHAARVAETLGQPATKATP